MHRAGRRLGWWENLLFLFRFLLFFLQFELVDLGLDLRLEFIGGTLELVERFPDLARDLRQLLGAEDQEGQHEDESGVAKTHVPIIAEQLAGSNATVLQSRWRTHAGYSPSCQTAQNKQQASKVGPNSAVEKGMNKLHIDTRVLSMTLVALLGLSLAVRPALAATYYPIIVPGSNMTSARGINVRSQVVGYYTGPSGGFQGFLLNHGKYWTVNYPGAPNTLLSGINKHEAIVGYYDDGIFIHGFTLVHGKFAAFDYPGASNTYASGIDDTGRIVGFYQVGGFTGGHGYELVDGNFTAIDVPGASATYASGINAAGDICGSFLDASGQLHGFLLHNGTFQTIDYPNSVGTNANGLNNSNQVVGGYVPSNLHNQGFLLSGTNLTSLSYPGSTITIASGINNRGTIVGTWSGTAGNQWGFVLIQAR